MGEIPWRPGDFKRKTGHRPAEGFWGVGLRHSPLDDGRNGGQHDPSKKFPFYQKGESFGAEEKLDTGA